MICSMIIKAIRFLTRSNVKRLINHLKNGNDNDVVEFVSGTAADITDMHLDASAKRSTYSIRHFIVAPHEATTRQQMQQVVAMIAKEFDFDAARAVVVEHKKQRTTADAHGAHWHVLVGEIDPASGKVLRCSFDRIIHELIARWSEFKFGHRFVLGKHTKSVIAGLKKRGAVDTAQELEAEFAQAKPPMGEAFTQSQHQEKKRAGINLPAIRQVVKAAVANATTRADLEAFLMSKSLSVIAGQKEGTWIVNDLNGNLVGSLSRLSGSRKSDIDDLMRNIRNESTDEDDEHRTSHPQRSPRNPSGPRQLDQLRDAEPRNTDPNAEQDSGVPRTTPDQARMPQSTGASAAFPNLKPSGWIRTLGSHQTRLSELLGRANTLAMKPAERVIAAIWHLEEQAEYDLHRVLPVFKFSETVTRLHVDIKSLERKLLTARDHHFNAESRFRKAPRVRWWHYLLGVAFILERRFRALEDDAREASDQVSGCERSLYKLNSKVVAEEVAEKRRHETKIREIVERKRDAGPTLELVESAYDILRLQPGYAFGGTDFVLSKARAVLQDKKEAALKASMAESNVVSPGPTI
jgi:hypothetical protein